MFAASEGLIGVGLEPTDDGDSVYCLVPRAMFFEFLPLDGDDTLLADELAPGRLYELVVTTLGGLCRYRIGDVVEFVKYHEGHAPVCAATGRPGSRVRGEKQRGGARGGVARQRGLCCLRVPRRRGGAGLRRGAAMDWDRPRAPRRRPAARLQYLTWRTKGASRRRASSRRRQRLDAYAASRRLAAIQATSGPEAPAARVLLAGEASTAPPAEAEPGTLVR